MSLTRRPAAPHHLVDARPAGALGQATPGYGEAHNDGGDVTARFVVMATGRLSMPKQAEVDGRSRCGEVYFTSRWPHEPVDFTDKRVAVIGTGSSGVQSIPVIAEEARELVVFQRTPNFSIPARNGPLSPEKLAQLANEAEYRAAARVSWGGIPGKRSIIPTFSVSESERQVRFERAWEGGLLFETFTVFADVLSNPAANHEFAEFFRNKIRSIVDDPQTAADLCPTDHPIGTKRPCLDTNYYATYNLPHVRLVNVRQPPRSDRSRKPASTPPTSHSPSTRSSSPPRPSTCRDGCDNGRRLQGP